jgi:hypothetical protein
VIRILTFQFKVLFPSVWVLRSRIYVGKVYHWRIKVYQSISLVVYVFVSGQRVIILNFHILLLAKVVYFSPINQIHRGTVIIALVLINIKCYIRFIFVRNDFISLTEIIAFQRLRMNIFAVHYTRNFMYKFIFLGS